MCIYMYVCVCRLQVFTISGARRRLYFALRGSTNIHTHTDASMRLFARVYACTHTHVHRHRYRCTRKRGKESSTHTHTCIHIYIHSLTRTLETMAVFLLYVAELTQRDTHAHRHTYTNRPNGRERESESERERAAGRPAGPGQAISCRTMCSRKNQRGQLLHLPAQRTRLEQLKMANWLTKARRNMTN